MINSTESKKKVSFYDDIDKGLTASTKNIKLFPDPILRKMKMSKSEPRKSEGLHKPLNELKKKFLKMKKITDAKTKSDALFILDFICDRVIILCVKQRVTFDNAMSKLIGEVNLTDKELKSFLQKTILVTDKKLQQLFAEYFKYVLAETEIESSFDFENAPIDVKTADKVMQVILIDHFSKGMVAEIDPADSTLEINKVEVMKQKTKYENDKFKNMIVGFNEFRRLIRKANIPDEKLLNEFVSRLLPNKFELQISSMCQCLAQFAK